MRRKGLEKEKKRKGPKEKEQETTTQRVLKNSLYNFLLTALSKIGGLIFTVVVARLLFPELFGIYSLALAIILTIATFTDLGINATLSRYLAEALKEKRPQEARQRARARLYFLLNFKIVFTAVTSIALFLLANAIAEIFKKPLLALPLKIGAIYLFVISLQGFFSSVFYAIQNVKFATAGEGIFQLLRIALVLIFLSLYKNVGLVFVALTIAMLFSFLFLFFVLNKRYSFLLKGKRSRLEQEEKKRLLGFFGWLTISSISLVFFVHVDTFMLGFFLPAEFAGYYNAIFSIVGAIAAFVAFGSVLLPVFTQLEQNRIERGFGKVFRYVAMLAIPAAIGLAFVAVPAIQVIYGQAYVPSSYKLAIVITSVLLSLLVLEAALTNIYSTLFQAKELPKIPSILIIIVSIANIILNYVFIKLGISIAPQYGLVGVAAATLLTRYCNMFALAILARKKLGIKTEIRTVIKPLVASAIMLAFLFAFDYFVAMSIWTGIAMIAIAIVVYFVIMLFIKGITRRDLELVRIITE
jgi:O-antigen/teichoic acid export membrane protein